MRAAVWLAALVACLLLASVLSVAGDRSVSSPSTSGSSTSAAASSATTDGFDDDAAPVKIRPAGSVQRGGKRIVRGPNFRKGAADGSTLPPYDPFGINWRHTKRQERRQARRQAKVEEENQRQLCEGMKARARRRIAIEKREAEAARREAQAELEREKKLKAVETDLLELAADSLMEVDADADADSEAYAAHELSVAAEAEAELDLDAEIEAEVEAEADEAETVADLAEMEADMEAGDLTEIDADVEGEVEAEAEAEADAEGEESQLLEKQSEQSQVTPIVHRNIRKRLQPSSHVTYGRELLSEEEFDNGDSRAVFKRRARGREIVRFQRLTTSTAGQAVVNGVTRTPCGKEITDKGLFGAVVLSNPGPTVEAANPAAPVLTDENLPVIKKLPVVPQFKEAAAKDEYGDE